MTDDPKPVNSFIAALEQELAACNTGLPPDTDPDTAYLMGIARSLNWRTQEIAQVREWAAKLIKTRQAEIDYIWSSQRLDIARTIQRKARGRAKSVKVPGMLFGQRSKKPSIEWAKEDAAAVIAWAQANCPKALSVTAPEPTTKPLKTELLAYFEQTGRVPHGCRHMTGGDETYYRPQKLGAAEEAEENGDAS